MSYSRLSGLRGILNDNQIRNLESYFSGLIGGAACSITTSKVAKMLGVTLGMACEAMRKCEQIGVVKSFYAVRCPNCHMLIKKVDNIKDIPATPFECYACNEEVEIDLNDVEVLYSVEQECFFDDGQQKLVNLPVSTVVPEDSLRNIMLNGGINEFLFHPTDEEYAELQQMYEKIKIHNGTTKAIGDTLESLVIRLFNLCPIFKAVGIKTTTNQIDCCVRNKLFLQYGILGTIGKCFYIECKNEKRTPKGDYMSKLHSIISLTNARNTELGIRFGIIISMEKGPSNFKHLAVKSYLADKIIIISICGEELEQLFVQKGNLLEIIERKTQEIIMDSTTDLVAAGLFSS